MAERSVVRGEARPVSNMLESPKGDREPRTLKQLDLDVRHDVDRELLTRGKAFMKRSADAGRPFFLHFI
jgi:arylsulfatase